MNRLLPTRRLIPKWRKSGFSVRQPDMLGLVKPTASHSSVQAQQVDVDQALWAWNNSGSIGDLADLLAFGVDPTQRDKLIEPAKVAARLEQATPAMRLVAREILSEGASQDEVWQKSSSAQDAKALRALLRNTPNDVIALVDLAQHHLAHGKQRAAHRALVVAHQVSPHAVHVIRAMTRYWVHVGEEDRAHAFIKGSSRVSVDPWLMASEIATAQVARAASTQLKRAQRALNVKSFSNQDVSELAGAVAGLELNHGNLKEARKLFRLALEHPNDNVLAQAIVNQEFLGIDVDEQVLRRASNGVFEGRALRAILQADFDSAATLTDCWAQEEPFSSRPRTLQSFVCGALGKYEAAIDAATQGLVADAADLSLRGNRAYALAAMGRLDEASAELAILEARGDENQRPFTLATKGMVHLLRGEEEVGRQLYEEALSEFRKKKHETLYTDCLAFMARTVTVATPAHGPAAVMRAMDQFTKSPSEAAAVILKGLNESVRTFEAKPLRKVVQWEWDPQTNTLMEKRQLTRKGSSGFVVAGDRGKSK